MRLQKYIASCGLTSRRKAEEWIQEGRVSVNGKIAKLGDQIEESDEVLVDGKPLVTEEKRYILLNKPAGYVCTSEDRHAERTVHDIVKTSERLYTVGRLDKDTEGLILLTNDGVLTNALTHPSHQVLKSYEALVQGCPTEEEMKKLRTGVRIEDDQGGRFTTSPCKAEILARMDGVSLVELTIHEGKKRQVRKMLKAVGHPVRKLKRVREGSLSLTGLSVGSYRDLTKKELKRLKKEVGLL